ncbi:hypothetical protein BED46_019725 [Burkholderia contaminans]|uniref:Uncharacterized protein n=1 Tax=Burkholderia contaminans LMG 23361 TaxID=1334628 RepID=A0ABD4AXJ7_9BURK|nr:hypothetical protein WR31_10560 [Burkholderia contaminans LMG 23361]ODN28222.1 hypothetical protein BGI28_09355 [Burkholderia contaminans]OMI80483.1 hypothetical protein BED46_019725 [Burkholderia contaminans]
MRARQARNHAGKGTGSTADGGRRAAGRTRQDENSGPHAAGEVDGWVDEYKETRKNGVHAEARQTGAQVRCVTGDDVY